LRHIRRPRRALHTGLAAAVAIGLALAAPGSASQARDGSGPCAAAYGGNLLCPNLKIAPPSDLYLEQARGRDLLRATSNVESRGAAAMELQGTRNGGRQMKVRQRIFKAGGGHRDFPVGIQLHFTSVGAEYGGSFWKVHDLAHFDLYSVNADGSLGSVVRQSPKLNYCLRDLERTQPGPRSPQQRHYPGCNQNRRRSGVRLGTSVGWSDIYPSTYDKQWIDVTGLRGCFAFVMQVDPAGALYELNESDNTSRRLVRLPWRGDVGC
jgi:hypothetical protein